MWSARVASRQPGGAVAPPGPSHTLQLGVVRRGEGAVGGLDAVARRRIPAAHEEGAREGRAPALAGGERGGHTGGAGVGAAGAAGEPAAPEAPVAGRHPHLRGGGGGGTPGAPGGGLGGGRGG